MDLQTDQAGNFYYAKSARHAKDTPARAHDRYRLTRNPHDPALCIPDYRRYAPTAGEDRCQRGCVIRCSER